MWPKREKKHLPIIKWLFNLLSSHFQVNEWFLKPSLILILGSVFHLKSVFLLKNGNV